MLTTPEVVTAVVAVIGLVLSVYNTVQARRDKRPKLKVRAYFGFVGLGPAVSDYKIFFDVGNGWNQTITLISICIPFPDKRSMAFPSLEGTQHMPVALSPGSSTLFWHSSDNLEGQMVKEGIGPHEKFRVMARDALGNEYLSNSVSFKPERRAKALPWL